MKSRLRLLAVAAGLLAAYLALWPVAVAPVAWDAPPNPGYTGDFAANAGLGALAFVDLQGRTGPEDGALGPDGQVYVATHDGDIVRIDPDDGEVHVLANTGGRPLGIEFGPDGTLYIADAYIGLLAMDAEGSIRLLADRAADGSPIRYANDVDIAADGIVYISDASTRFGARDHGGTLAASILDLVEHSANARVLRYDPATQQAQVFATGLTFANGVALSGDGAALMVAETGMYRVWRFPTDGGAGAVVLDQLPGFPDNLNHGRDGTFWLGLVSPRNAIMDRLSGYPFLRRLVMRLPEAVKPAPQRYGFVLRLDADGQVIETLQDPSGDYALTTGAVTLPDGRIAVTSLTEPRLGFITPQ